MAAKKSLPLDNYEKGLLILAITKVLNSGHDFSADDVLKLIEEDKLSDVVDWLVGKHHSKLPVYTRAMQFVGLLTTDALSEYLVQNIVNIQGKLPDIQVGDLLSKDKKQRNVKFIPVHTSIISVVTEFERSLTSGQRLNALIITQDGASNQKPLGIISVSDLPSIYEKLNSHLLR